MGRSAYNHPAKDHILTKAEVRRYALPLHMALVVLPLGGFTRDHANKLAGVCNIVLADAESRYPVAHGAAVAVGNILVSMFARVKEGKAWNVTASDREALMPAIVTMDHHVQKMTLSRLRVAVATSRLFNQEAKAQGWTFLDHVTINQEQQS